jgi:hypothetical protein
MTRDTCACPWSVLACVKSDGAGASSPSGSGIGGSVIIREGTPIDSKEKQIRYAGLVGRTLPVHHLAKHASLDEEPRDQRLRGRLHRRGVLCAEHERKREQRGGVKM